MRMTIEIDEDDNATTLRVLAHAFAEMAEAISPVPDQPQNIKVRAGEGVRVPLRDEIPLTDGDAPAQFVVTGTTDTTMSIEPVSTEFPIPPTVVAADSPQPGDKVMVEGPTPTAPRPRRKNTLRKSADPAPNAGEQLQLPDGANPDPLYTPAAPTADPSPASDTERTAEAPMTAAVPPAPTTIQQIPAAPSSPAVPSATTTSAMMFSAAPAAPVSAHQTSAPAANATPPTVPTPTIPNAATGNVPQTFPELMRAVSPALASKKLSADALNEACATVGATNLQGLLQNQSLVPAVYEIVAPLLAS